VTLGDAVLAAPGAQILAVNPNYGLVDMPIMDQGIAAEGIVIENGAWSGGAAVILDGVTIGKGAVIGANAVVTEDVPPHFVAVGSPARVIRRCDSSSPDPGLLREVGVLTCFGKQARIATNPCDYWGRAQAAR
jgi:acetyltransferase-like isoleucine patch superfamily enzyme